MIEITIDCLWRRIAFRVLKINISPGFRVSFRESRATKWRARHNNKHFANNRQWTILEKKNETKKRVRRTSDILLRWKNVSSILDMTFIFTLDVSRLFEDIFFHTRLVVKQENVPRCDVCDVGRNWCNIVRKAKLNALLIRTGPAWSNIWEITGYISKREKEMKYGVRSKCQFTTMKY